jgi:hypothetical protein
MADLQNFKDALAMDACGMTAAEAWAKGICIDCKEPALPKCHTEDGRGEYRISAMCEECFDEACKEPVACGDMFWDADDPEKAEESPEEILRDDYAPEHIAEFQQATRLPNFFGFYLQATDGTGEKIDEEQFHFFETKEEAEAACPVDGMVFRMPRD